ncbi:proline-rich protein 36-like isoform X3 [Halichondria panicea]|uniref:proline-rich protein 36-like isoform X3 n=1 Tax=Halichondria panicea TaxID=6063 RepID=UPI00312BC3C6
MPRGKRTRTTRSTATSRRSTRAATRNNSTATPPGQVVPITAGQPPAPPAPPPAQADFTAFLQVIRNEVRAELEAQRMAASSLPVSTQSQDPLELANSLPQPQQHPAQQQTPLTTGQQRQPTRQQQVMPIAQTVQPPQYQPTQGIGTLIPTTLQAALGVIPPPALLSSVPLTQNQLSAPSTYQSPQSSYGSGLILSPAEAPVPQKIVDKIRSGQFVEMRELLADNISLLEQLHSIHAPGNISAAGPSRPRMRDVHTLPLWLYCFLTYTVIPTTDQPTKDKLAYARLMILEASRHGHLGWLDYDRSFRQQAAVKYRLYIFNFIPYMQEVPL